MSTPVIHVAFEQGVFRVKATRYLGGSLFEAFREATSACKYNHATKANEAGFDTIESVIESLTQGGFDVETSDAVDLALGAWHRGLAAKKVEAEKTVLSVGHRLRLQGLSLYPFQAVGSGWLAGRHRAFLCDEMGLGKTIQALIALPANQGALVIVPAVVKVNWRNEVKKWRPDLYPTVLYGRESFRWPRTNEVVILNPDILPQAPKSEKTEDEDPFGLGPSKEKEKAKLDKYGRPKWTPPPPPARLATPCTAEITLVVDEAHVYKNPKSQRAKALASMLVSLDHPNSQVWALTATPLLNRAMELWSLFNLFGVANEAFGSAASFRKGFGAKLIQVSKTVKTWQYGEEADSTIGEGFSKVALRRMRADVLPELPTKTYQTLEHGTSRPRAKSIDMMGFADFIQAIELGASVEKLPNFMELSSALAALAEEKTKTTEAFVEGYEDAGEPVIVFSKFLSPVEKLGSRPGWAAIHGGVSAAKRGQIVEDFQAGKYKGLAGTIGAMGVGITLTRSAAVVFNDPEWVPLLNAQAEDRACRIGQTRGVVVTRVVADHVLDRRMAAVLYAKELLNETAINAGAVR